MKSPKHYWNFATNKNYRSAYKQKERTEYLLKTMADMRSLISHMPDSPDIVPYPQNGFALESMAKRSATLRTIIHNNKFETFRDLPKLEPVFEAKCPICGAEYQEYQEWCENVDCQLQGKKCLGPDVTQKKRFLDWKDKININDQNFFDLSRAICEEIDVSDNPWAVWSFDYKVDPLTGTILERKPVELNFAPSAIMRLVQDEYGRPGGKEWACPLHRDQFVSRKEYYSGKTCCNLCGTPLHNVTAISVMYGIPGSGVSREVIVDKRYIDGEWFHHPFWTSTTFNYGISNIYTAWIMASTEVYMDELDNNTYKHGRPPKTLLLFNTLNPKGLKATLTEEFQASKKDRNKFPILAHHFEGSTKDMAQVLNLMPTDDEMQTLEHRNEIQRKVSALFGNTPFMINEVETSGGLSSESLQYTMFYNKLRARHEWYESKFFAWVFSALHITDWSLKFPPLKKEDEAMISQVRAENLKQIGQIVDRGAGYRIVDQKTLKYELTGEISALLQGAGGMGLHEAKGSSWQTSDFQVKDQTFAFSKAFKKTDPELLRAIEEFLRDIGTIAGFGEEREEFFQVAFDELARSVKDYVLKVGVTAFRSGVESAGMEDFQLQPEMIALMIGDHDIEYALEKLRTDILDRITNLDDGDIIDNLLELGSVVRGRVENISRTESDALVNLGRAEGYRSRDPDDDYLDYDWVGPDFTPGRSTLVCQAIKERVDGIRAEKGRVSLDEIEKIIAEEGQTPHGDEKAFGLNRPFVPHYNCRHGLVGRTAMGKSTDIPDVQRPKVDRQRISGTQIMKQMREKAEQRV